VELLNEQLRVAPIVIFSVPNKFYGRRDKGDERLLSKKQWEKILDSFNVTKSENYYVWPSFVFKRRIFWLKPTMYLAKLKR
jgi:hypothetical protein